MDFIKEKLGEASANLVQDNFIVGLGTGSTANFFIKSLAKRCQKGLNVKAVASSLASEKLAKELNIQIIDFVEIDKIDIYIDGADEVDFEMNMIKGLGGALLKEKILANFSKKRIFIIEKRKYKERLFSCKLPIEITPFAHLLTKRLVDNLGYNSEFRKDQKGNLFITDNKNYILDLTLKHPIEDSRKVNEDLISIPGVLETGLFIELADQILIGSESSQIEIID
jgi:ribose 5-phosphate isomerase A